MVLSSRSRARVCVLYFQSTLKYAMLLAKTLSCYSISCWLNIVKDPGSSKVEPPWATFGIAYIQSAFLPAG